MKKIVMMFYFIILLFCAFVPKKIEANERISASISTNQIFSTDSIIVIVQNSFKDELKEYSVLDFDEIKPTVVLDNELYDLNQTCDFLETSKLETSENQNDMHYQSLTLRWDHSFSKQEIMEIIKILQDRDDVYHVQPNYLYELQSTIPNDAVTNYQSYYEVCEVLDAWDYTIGTKAIKVGILDSGIDGTHPDLIKNLDNNLHKDFTSTNEQPLVDNFGHGTAVAGVVGAKGNNMIGISGVCWDISLVSLKVLNPGESLASHYVESATLKQAINYADANNIQILNFSGHLESGSVDVDDRVVYNALQNYDGLFVCSAGNCEGTIGEGGYSDLNYNNDQHAVYPANYSEDLPNVISVGGVDTNGKRSNQSHYGERSVTLFASYDVYTTSVLDQSGYRRESGTSFSSPMVAGALALIYSIDVNLSPSEAKSILLNSCDDFNVTYINNSYIEMSYPGKRLNVYAAIKSILNSTISDLPTYYVQNTSYNDFSENVILSNNNLNYNNKAFYKLNVLDTATYQFRIDNSSCSNISIYDSNLNKLETNNCNSIGQVTIFKNLSIGTYYVKVETSYNYIDSINLEIHREFDYYLSYNVTNQFSINSIEDMNIRYTHQQNSGYYTISLNIFNSMDIQLTDYPDNMLEIYADDERSLLLVNTSSNLTINVYLEYGEIYYFDIETNLSDLSTFTIFITENS